MIPILVILLLILINGLFAMAEMAVVSARKTRLQQLAAEGSTGAQTALDLASNPDRFLSTIQIGITLIGILAGAFGERTLANDIATRLNAVERIAPYGEALAFGLVVVVITYLSLILGELVPKRLALHSPEKIATIMGKPMHFLSRLGRPGVQVLGASTRFVLRLLGAKPSTEPPVTEEEIKVMMEQGAEAGVFEEAEHKIVSRIFKLGDRAVGELMIQRRDVVWLDIDEPFEENRRRMASSLFSRFPVAQGTLDNVLGIVQAKDLLTRSLAGGKLALKELIRPPLFVPEALPALKLLEMFKKSRTHIALVVDEYGGVEGLITLNDIMEDLVGDVASADMPEEKQAFRRPDGSWILDGRLMIDELKEILSIERLPEDESGGYQTLGGLVMLQVGRVPVTGDSFETAGNRFEVVDMDGKRVDKVLVTPLPKAEHEEQT